MTRFTVDRKLDNKRIEIDCVLVRLSFSYGDQEIGRKEIKYKSKSGYCLDAVQDPGRSGYDTVNIEDIGKVQTWHNRNASGGIYYVAYCYPDIESEAAELIKSKVRMYKENLLLKALAVPTL